MNKAPLVTAATLVIVWVALSFILPSPPAPASQQPSGQVSEVTSDTQFSAKPSAKPSNQPVKKPSGEKKGQGQ